MPASRTRTASTCGTGTRLARDTGSERTGRARSATATARSSRSSGSGAWLTTIWNAGRTTNRTQAAAVMLYVHGLMGDAAPGEAAPDAIGRDGRGCLRARGPGRGALPRPVPDRGVDCRTVSSGGRQGQRDDPRALGGRETTLPGVDLRLDGERRERRCRPTSRTDANGVAALELHADVGRGAAAPTCVRKRSPATLTEGLSSDDRARGTKRPAPCRAGDSQVVTETLERAVGKDAGRRSSTKRRPEPRPARANRAVIGS